MNAPFTIEKTYNASIDKVWKAITNKEDMQQWYFDLAEFKPELDFEFRFTAGADNKQYLHICKIKEVIPGKKLTYSWKYDGYKGISFVTFELFEEGNKTRLKLSHAGLESFPQNNPDFARENFEEGWKEITGTLLKNFVESKA